jgi:ABC-type transport system substrate-binding protein
MMFERGELDMLFSIPAPDFVRLTADSAWKPYVSSLPVNETVYLSLNCELAPFTDRRVRQALNNAVDKDRILKIINGRGVAARGVLPPLLPGYNPKLTGYPHDPTKARQLLAEAGYPDGFTVALWAVADSGSWLKIAEAVQQDLAEVGIRVEVKPVAYAIFDEAVGRRGTVPFALTSWPQDYPDPSDFLDVLFRSDRLTEARCNNTAFYTSPRLDTLLQAAARETDPRLRLRRYQKAEEVVAEDAPWVFLYHPTDYRLCQPWVQGFQMHPVWAARFDKLGLERP